MKDHMNVLNLLVNLALLVMTVQALATGTTGTQHSGPDDQNHEGGRNDNWHLAMCSLAVFVWVRY